MNAHDTILAAVLAALRAAPAVTTGSIEEDVDALALPEGKAESVSVSLVGSTPVSASINNAPVEWTTQIMIECAARADGRTVAGRASRALHAAVYARLMSDTTLAGKAHHVLDPQISQDRALADTRIGITSGLYTVLHRTAGLTLEVA
jgi:hypothetical protein